MFIGTERTPWSCSSRPIVLHHILKCQVRWLGLLCLWGFLAFYRWGPKVWGKNQRAFQGCSKNHSFIVLFLKKQGVSLLPVWCPRYKSILMAPNVKESACKFQWTTVWEVIIRSFLMICNVESRAETVAFSARKCSSYLPKHMVSPRSERFTHYMQKFLSTLFQILLLTSAGSGTDNILSWLPAWFWNFILKFWSDD